MKFRTKVVIVALVFLALTQLAAAVAPTQDAPPVEPIWFGEYNAMLLVGAIVMLAGQVVKFIQVFAPNFQPPPGVFAKWTALGAGFLVILAPIVGWFGLTFEVAGLFASLENFATVAANFIVAFLAVWVWASGLYERLKMLKLPFISKAITP
jgi:hypothetical protein